MTDRKLTITENNIIDATRKLAYCGVFHNFRKNPEVISFSSELANKMFRELTLDNSKKVSMNSSCKRSDYIILILSSFYLR